MAGLWMRWVRQPATLRAHDAGDPQAIKSFLAAKNAFNNIVVTVIAPSFGICLIGCGVCLLAGLAWMVRRKSLQAKMETSG